MYEVIIDNGNSNEKHDILPRKCVLRVLFHKKKKNETELFFSYTTYAEHSKSSLTDDRLKRLIIDCC